MENLLNDSSFEVYHNSEGSKILGWDRTLMQYPDEKNSFDVFMGFTDENPKDGKDDATGKTQEQLKKEEEEKLKLQKQKEREEKFKQYASIGKDTIQTGQAVYGAVQSFQTDEKKNIKPLS